MPIEKDFPLYKEYPEKLIKLLLEIKAKAVRSGKVVPKTTRSATADYEFEISYGRYIEKYISDAINGVPEHEKKHLLLDIFNKMQHFFTDLSNIIIIPKEGSLVINQEYQKVFKKITEAIFPTGSRNEILKKILENKQFLGIQRALIESDEARATIDNIAEDGLLEPRMVEIFEALVTSFATEEEFILDRGKNYPAIKKELLFTKYSKNLLKEADREKYIKVLEKVGMKTKGDYLYLSDSLIKILIALNSGLVVDDSANNSYVSRLSSSTPFQLYLSKVAERRHNLTKDQANQVANIFAVLTYLYYLGKHFTSVDDKPVWIIDEGNPFYQLLFDPNFQVHAIARFSKVLANHEFLDLMGSYIDAGAVRSRRVFKLIAAKQHDFNKCLSDIMKL